MKPATTETNTAMHHKHSQSFVSQNSVTAQLTDKAREICQGSTAVDAPDVRFIHSSKARKLESLRQLLSERLAFSKLTTT